MPRETRYIADLLLAIQDNNFHDVRFIVENRLKRRERQGIPGILGCVPDKDGVRSLGIYKELEPIVLAASRREDPTILRYLAENGANINFVSDSTTNGKKVRLSPLHVAVNNGLYDTMAILLEHNADVNRVDHHQRTPLHLAIRRTDCEAVRMMLSRGAKLHLTDDTGYTPLQQASKFGHVELVRILLEYKAQIFPANLNGPSPLHIAAMEGHVPLIDMFSHYADVNIKVPCTVDGKSKAAIHLASEKGYVETVRFLVERFGGDINITDSDGNTALHCSLQHQHDHRRMRRIEDFEILVDFLIKQGIHVDHQNKNGETALHLAARNQFHKVAEYLLLASSNAGVKNKKAKTPKDSIPDFDLPMKQIFEKYGVFSSPYISHQYTYGQSTPCPSVSVHNHPSSTASFTAKDMQALVTADDAGKVVLTVNASCSPTPTAPVIAQ